MTIAHIILYGLVAVFGPVVVATKDPLRQSMVAGFFGLVLTLLFFVLHSPDVSLAAIVVGSVGLPLMILLALARIRGMEK